ncbi:hypothetical protein [uncultured Brevundimonas sp.]|uniref:hypothetical protein n=1 Tax=uncultured Brevundimonas sp. TaxID=213418 RepID=UPI002617E699|nr:hypothetical protein [uncultured Brevundimonas sp.]
MTTRALPRWSSDLRVHPRPVVLAALALILAGAVVVAAPEPAGPTLGGTSGWLLWFAGMTILSAWLLLLLAGRPLRGLLIAGAVAAASGAFLFYSPRTGTAAITILAISTLVMDGGIQLALALDLRPAGAWRWLFASALASAVAVIAVSGGALDDTAPGWGPLVGLALISSGLALVMFSRTAAPESAPR